VLIFYPMIFSMTHIEARYRHPIEPVIYLLAAYAGCEFYDGYKKWMEGRKFRSNVSALTYRLTQ
jgi:hypothetical protein